MDFLQAYSDDEDEDTDGHQLASETIPSSVTIYPSNQLTSVTTSVIAGGGPAAGISGGSGGNSDIHIAGKTFSTNSGFHHQSARFLLKNQSHYS